MALEIRHLDTFADLHHGLHKDCAALGSPPAYPPTSSATLVADKSPLCAEPAPYGVLAAGNPRLGHRVARTAPLLAGFFVFG